MAQIPVYYEIPVVLFVLIGVYVVYMVVKFKDNIPNENIRKAYNWLLASALTSSLWGLDHIYHDLVGLSENLKDLFHYGISHGFLLISIIFLGVFIMKINKAYSSSTDSKPKEIKK